MFGKLRSVFFSLNPARKELSRVRSSHYEPTAPVLGSWPKPLTDLPNGQIADINLKSDQYFSHQSQQKYWRNKPLSDLDYGPQCLWRFGLLLSALRIRPEDRVLDFGCGTGWTSIMMTRTGAEITGMDISGKALEMAQNCAVESLTSEDLARLRFQIFNGKTIDAPDGYFDFVITLDAFHHLPNPLTILKEFNRVLNHNGCFGFAEPGFGHSLTDLAQHESEHGVLEEDVDPEQLRTTARSVGFDELELIVPPVPPDLLTLTMPRARWYLRGLPWIVPHDYIRTSILASPLGILRKGPYTSTSLHPARLEATIRPLEETIKVSPGQEFIITASVENKTGTVWLKRGRRGTGYVRLGAQLLNSQEQVLVQEFGRAEIPNDMRQNDKSILQLQLRAPQDVGKYLIQLDMVDEGITWFSEKGSKPPKVQLLIT